MNFCSYCGKYKFRQAIPHDCPEKKAVIERQVRATVPPPPPPPVVLPTEGRRHCIYYVLPANHNGVWQSNVEQLKARENLFTGRKVCVIATGPRPSFAPLDPPDKVRQALGGGWECVEVKHDRRLREMAAWDIWWDRLMSDHQPDDVCFMAHAKGVSKPVDPGVTVHKWSQILYSSLLDYWPLTHELLERCPIVGSFKKVGDNAFGGSRSAWHYSGSFCWFRVKDAWAREPLKRVDKKWFGIESWPGLAFGTHEAGVVFCEGKQPELNMYLQEIARPIFEQWEVWKEQNKRCRTVPAPASNTGTTVA